MFRRSSTPQAQQGSLHGHDHNDSPAKNTRAAKGGTKRGHNQSDDSESIVVMSPPKKRKSEKGSKTDLNQLSDDKVWSYTDEEIIGKSTEWHLLPPLITSCFRCCA